MKPTEIVIDELRARQQSVRNYGGAFELLGALDAAINEANGALLLRDSRIIELEKEVSELRNRYDSSGVKLSQLLPEHTKYMARSAILETALRVSRHRLLNPCGIANPNLIADLAAIDAALRS